MVPRVLIKVTPLGQLRAVSNPDLHVAKRSTDKRMWQAGYQAAAKMRSVLSCRFLLLSDRIVLEGRHSCVYCDQVDGIACICADALTPARLQTFQTETTCELYFVNDCVRRLKVVTGHLERLESATGCWKRLKVVVERLEHLVVAIERPKHLVRTIECLERLKVVIESLKRWWVGLEVAQR